MARLIIFVVVAFITMIGGQNSALAQEVKTLKYGIIEFLTGPAAIWGIPCYRSIALGAWKVNDQGGFKVGSTTFKWDPLVYDSKYIPAEAVKAANRAIFADKVFSMTVGGGSCAVACLPLLKENNMISLSNAGAGKTLTNPDNPLMFRYNASIESMYAAFLPFLVQREKVTTLATINPDDETGKSGLEAAKMFAETNKIKIVAEEFFERGIKDFSPLLARVIARNPDLIETGYTDPTSAALINKQAREIGFKGVILLSWMPDPKQVLAIGRAHAEKTYMSISGPIEPQTQAQKEFYDRYLKKWPANEWDPIIWILTETVPCLTKAIVETQSFDSVKLANHLGNMTWDSPIGALRFGGSRLFGIKRQLIFPLAVYQVQNGKLAYLGIPPVPGGILD